MTETVATNRFTCGVCNRSFIANADTAICTGAGSTEERDEDGVLLDYEREHRPALMDKDNDV